MKHETSSVSTSFKAVLNIKSIEVIDKAYEYIEFLNSTPLIKVKGLSVNST